MLDTIKNNQKFTMLKRNIKDTHYLYFFPGFIEGYGSISLSVTIQ